MKHSAGLGLGQLGLGRESAATAYRDSHCFSGDNYVFLGALDLPSAGTAHCRDSVAAVEVDLGIKGRKLRRCC